MKTLSQVIEDNKQHKNLINAVIRQLGGDDESTWVNIHSINGHGINGGYHGFIWYTDTVAFWRQHKKLILALAEEQTESFGDENILSFVKNFNCFKDEDINDIAKALYGRYDEELTQIYNGMAWYAGEEVCRMFEDD